MCSWCWGFAPVMRQIMHEYAQSLTIQLVLVPFRLEQTHAMDQNLRNYVLGQWRKVHTTTGQEFDFSFNVSEQFVYNPLLVCKAIKAFAILQKNQELAFMHSLQQAFYTKSVDITVENVLIDIAHQHDIGKDLFATTLRSQQVTTLLEQDFTITDQYTVRSYPTVVIEQDAKSALTCSGYTPFSELKKQIDSWL